MKQNISEKEIDLKTLKEKQLEIFQYFISTCAKFGLKYFATGGTLLGAVRHQGYIPWDDDIDVCMPRQDYDLFVKNAQSALPNFLFVQTHTTDPDYRNCFAKLRNINTTYVETVAQNLKINHGIYIDIFPIDAISENKTEFKKMVHHKKMIQWLCGKDYLSDGFFKRKLKGFLAGLNLHTFNTSKALSKFENRCRKYSYGSTKQTILFGGAWGEKEIHDTNVYGEGIMLPFENLKIVAPTDYKQFLTDIYGDYMKLPPKEKQVSHHNCCAFNPNKGYNL